MISLKEMKMLLTRNENKNYTIEISLIRRTGFACRINNKHIIIHVGKSTKMSLENIILETNVNNHKSYSEIHIAAKTDSP